MCIACLVIALPQIIVLCIRIGRLLVLRPNLVLFANIIYDAGRRDVSRGLRVQRGHPRGPAHLRCKLCANVQRLSRSESTLSTGALTEPLRFPTSLCH